MSRADPSESRFPLGLVVWGAIGIALNVGLARFTYGVMLPAIRRDLDLGYLGSGNLNGVHLTGYLIGTLAAPWLIARTGTARLSRWAHLLVAAGALTCALAPESRALGSAVLGIGRFATGLGAGAGIVAILVLVFNAVPATLRSATSAAVWAGMGVAIVASGFAVPLLLGPAIGWRLAFAFSALLALAFAFGFPPKTGRHEAPAPALGGDGIRFSSRRLLGAGWLFLVAAYLLFGIAYVGYSTFAGAQLAAMKAPTHLVGATWIGFGVTSMVGAALTVPIAGSPHTRRFALVAALASGAAGALVAALDTGAAAFVGALLVGLGLAATPTFVTAFARERCTADEYPRVFSYASAALGIGQLIGPIASGALADRFGTVAVPVFAAIAYGIAASLAIADGVLTRRSK
ncbi:MAG: YbfB/YjiJ family MFS transporter [Caldimonas sp.]